MDNLNYIENYFSNQLAPEHVRQFEKKIEQDPAFAREVAFYLSAKQISRETSLSEQRQRFKELYRSDSGNFTSGQPGRTVEMPLRSNRSPVRKLVYLFAAAAVAAGIIFGIYSTSHTVPPAELASQYIDQHFQTLGVTMSGHADSLQNGLRLYNEGKINGALAVFENLSASNDSAFDAEKYAGLSALRLKQYDKALHYFKRLGNFKGLFANPALFLQALTLMDRNQPGDAVLAKELLQKVVDDNQEGKDIAVKWLSLL